MTEGLLEQQCCILLFNYGMVKQSIYAKRMFTEALLLVSGYASQHGTASNASIFLWRQVI